MRADSPNAFGQFADVSEAVAAAATAQKALVRMSLAQREIACDLIRNICTNRAQELGDMEYEETRLGHKPHKTDKLLAVGREAAGTKGMRTECFSGDHGITLEEHGPWGVIAVVTPVTHSLPTLATNAINMLAAGNALVCNPHPAGKRIAAFGAKLFNQAIYEKLGIDNLICVIIEPTIESAQALFRHPGTRMIVVTGGPGVVAGGEQERQARDRGRAGQSAGGGGRDRRHGSRRGVHHRGRGLRQQPALHRPRRRASSWRRWSRSSCPRWNGQGHTA